jgi:hypothetical protein
VMPALSLAIAGWGIVRWVSQFLSVDDLWSVVGYGLLLSVNRLTSSPLPLSSVSLLASGMIAIVWLLGKTVRARNLERHPNARVVFWAAVAAASVLASVR